MPSDLLSKRPGRVRSEVREEAEPVGLLKPAASQAEIARELRPNRARLSPSVPGDSRRASPIQPSASDRPAPAALPAPTPPVDGQLNRKGCETTRLGISHGGIDRAFSHDSRRRRGVPGSGANALGFLATPAHTRHHGLSRTVYMCTRNDFDQTERAKQRRRPLTTKESKYTKEIKNLEEKRRLR